MSGLKVGEILEAIRYKEGWTLNFCWSATERYLRWIIKDESAPNGLWNCRKWQLSPHMTESEIVQTAFLALQVAEEHELRERFTYHGIAVLGPHWDLGRILELAVGGYLRESVRAERGVDAGPSVAMATALAVANSG